jgi:uracil-DNA glycosylase family 4
LSELLEIAGLDRERDCWIGNRVKCRPPGNRDPEPGELAACLPYLERQLQILRPDVVVTLGRFATWYYIPGAKISQIHGRVQPPIRGTVIYPVYHPSAALHNPAYRDVLKADFERLDRLLPRIKARLEELRQKEDPFPAGV